MADFKLRIFSDLDGPADAVHEILKLAEQGGLGGPHRTHEYAQKLYAYEALQPPPAPARDGAPEPYSLQWFLDIQNQRHSKHGRWIPRCLEFAKHPGETLLGLGHGLGTDWVQYAHHGARVIVCSPAKAQLELVRRNFKLRALSGIFLHAEPTRLPLNSSSVDVVCISSLHHGIDAPQAVIDEVYRVLKPGGKVLAVTPARYDVDYWARTLFFWYRWIRPTKYQSTIDESNRYSARQLTRLFARFEDHHFRKRQLRRQEVPHAWRLMPASVLARLMGRVLVMKAFKPLSSVRNEQNSEALAIGVL